MAASHVADLGTILSVWAHPDDGAYLCGGLMATAVDSGARVVCVTATFGDTVLTFAADGRTGHPDRVAVHRWTAEFVPMGAVGEPPVPGTGPLSIDLTLTGDVLERKLAGLAAQTSQTEALRAAVGEDYYRQVFGTERFGIVAV